MSQVISEGLEYIGRIDDVGYVFDKKGDCVAKIDESGYLNKLGSYGYYGKIDRDGTIRDASLAVVGNIQKDGYVYVHSKRVCHVDSEYVRSITPEAWNYGHAGSYDTDSNTESSGSSFHWPFRAGTTVKLIVGTVMGIGAIVTNAGALGFGGCLMAIPVCIGVVFLCTGIIKIVSGQ